jgi:hypothetical protein
MADKRSTAVHQFLKRNGLDDVIPAIEKDSIEKLFQLRRLTEDETRFAQLVPDAAKRSKIKDALAKSPSGGAAAATAGGNGSAPAPAGGAVVRACRDFHSKGSCAYGGECKFSHDLNAPPSPDDSPAGSGVGGGGAAAHAVADSYEENVTIQAEMVKFLLKDQGRAIGAIHRQFHTSNERIRPATAFEEFITFAVRGSKENVQNAIKAIHHAIGMESQAQREARYQYAAKELEFNLRSVDHLLAGNAKNKGTCLELSPASLLAVAQTFRFPEPAKVHHFVVYAGVTDKEKNERLVSLLKVFPAIQAMLFVPHNRVDEMEKRASTTRVAFRDVPPVFVHRDLSKEERMKNFESFKAGNAPASDAGLINRLLVTPNDFAKLARKVAIPYVNLVVHFNATDKETYAHQMNCTGRRGKPGISLLVASPEFSKELVDGLRKDHEITVLDGSAASTDKWLQTIAALSFDSAATPLTEADDYPGRNWQTELQQEKERLEAEGIVKQAPPKPKPKAKKQIRGHAGGAPPAWGPAAGSDAPAAPAAGAAHKGWGPRPL